MNTSTAFFREEYTYSKPPFLCIRVQASCYLAREIFRF